MFLVAAYFTHPECFRMIIKSLSPISNDPNEVNQPNVEAFFESFLVKPFKLKVNYCPMVLIWQPYITRQIRILAEVFARQLRTLPALLIEDHLTLGMIY
jgi:hypothetical protein